MARGDVRIAVTLACEDCKRRNYQTNKSRRNSPDRIELRKFCRWCGRHTAAQGNALGRWRRPGHSARPSDAPARRRSRNAQAAPRTAGESRAQHDTQVPVSGEVAEVEAVEAGIAAGASEAELETPDAPKPTRTQRRDEAKKAKGSRTARARRPASAASASSSPSARSRRPPSVSAAESSASSPPAGRS